MKKTAI